MITTILSTILVLGVLIFIHELGHFLVAKKVGIRVERFSLGFPPYIFSKKFGETIYSIGAIPLGGFVKMTGENPDDETTGAPNEFMSKSAGRRLAVILAGPFMNYVLAVVFLICVAMFAGTPFTDPDRVLVGQVIKDGPAQQAGIAAGDQIITVNGQAVSSFEDLVGYVHPVVENPIDVSWVSGADTLTATIVTMLVEYPNIQGGKDTVGNIGISEKIVGYQRYGFGEAVRMGFRDSYLMAAEVVGLIKMLLLREASLKALGGPLFIAQVSGQAARRGLASLIRFMAFLSINLALLNILPIPILDGGHLVFLLIEKLKGSPLSMKARAIAMQIGLITLLALIVSVTYNDILRFFGRF